MKLLLQTLPLIVLFSQMPDLSEQAKRDLERDKRLALGTPSRTNLIMITVIASYGDGTPVRRGYINCDGHWCKYGGGPTPEYIEPGEPTEPDLCGMNFPFRTDSRGACIFNPPTYWTSDGRSDDDSAGPMTCYAQAGVRAGKQTFYPYNGGVYRITIPGPAPKGTL